jgi:hypothetical protein
MPMMSPRLPRRFHQFHTLLEASAHGSLLLRCVPYAVPIYPYHELGNV